MCFNACRPEADVLCDAVLRKVSVAWQDKADEEDRQAQYEKQHGRPEWADILHITPETWAYWASLKAGDPLLHITGIPDPEMLAYFKVERPIKEQEEAVVGGFAAAASPAALLGPGGSTKPEQLDITWDGILRQLIAAGKYGELDISKAAEHVHASAHNGRSS